MINNQSSHFYCWLMLLCCRSLYLFQHISVVWSGMTTKWGPCALEYDCQFMYFFVAGQWTKKNQNFGKYTKFKGIKNFNCWPKKNVLKQYTGNQKDILSYKGLTSVRTYLIHKILIKVHCDFIFAIIKQSFSWIQTVYGLLMQ